MCAVCVLRRAVSNGPLPGRGLPARRAGQLCQRLLLQRSPTHARLFLVWPRLVDGSVAGGGAQSAFSVFDVSSTELTVTFIDSAGTVLYKVCARAPNAEPLSLRPALSFRRPQTPAIKPRAKAEKPGLW